MNRTISIIWVPILAAVAVLTTVYFGSSLYTGQTPVTLLGYIAIAGLYGKLLSDQPAFSNRRRPQDSIITVTSVYALAVSLLITTGIAFFAILLGVGEQWRTLIFLIIPLIISTVVGGLSNASNQQLTEGFERRTEERSRSLESRNNWETILKRKNQETDDTRIKNEIARILQIIRYSSYFRSPKSWTDLEQLEKSVSNDQILEILTEVK